MRHGKFVRFVSCCIIVSQELVYEAEYAISGPSSQDIAEILDKIMSEQEGFIRANQSLPFSSDYSLSMEFVRSYRERPKPIKMKFKEAINFIDEKEVEQYHYNEDLKNTRPEMVQVVNFTIIPKDDHSVLRVRTEPVAIHHEAQLGYKIENLDSNTLSRIHDKQEEFISRNFEPLASGVISEPSPKAAEEIVFPDSFEKFPEECKNSLIEARECYKNGLATASSMMVARGLEAGLAKKYEEAGNEINPENGQPVNLADLLNWIKQSKDFDIPRKLIDFFSQIKWQRRVVAHYSDGVLPDEDSLEQFFSRSLQILEEVYSEIE